MKGHLLAAVMLLVQIGWCEPAKLQDYPVKDIPLESEKFGSIFLSVSASEMAANLSKLGVYSRIKLVQNVAGQRYIGEFKEELIAIDLLESHKKYADDTELDICIEDTGEIYEYIAVFGNKKSVRLYREKGLPPKMTLEDFVVRLKKVESFIIQVPGQMMNCKVCRGTGEVYDSSGVKKIRCKSCGGVGGRRDTLSYRVVWESPADIKK